MSWSKSESAAETQPYKAARTARTGFSHPSFPLLKTQQLLIESFSTAGAKLLAEALHSLPEEKREVVLLYYFFDMSEREIAKFCNIPRTTVQTRRTSSMKLLKRYLEERAYDYED